MTMAAWVLIGTFIGYPIFKYLINRFNEQTDENLREVGFDVPPPRKRRN